MRRIALIIIAGLVLLGLICQLMLINMHQPPFAEPKIITLALTSELVLLAAVIILLRTLYLFKHQSETQQEINHQLQLELNEQNRLSDTLFDDTAISIVKADLNGQIIRANLASSQLLGYRDEEAVRANYFTIVDPKDLQDLQSHIQDMLDGKIKVYQCEQQCLKKNGERLWVLLTMTMMHDEMNAPAYFVIQLENITLQKRAEERLHHMAYHDPLTGLANRNKLEQFVNHVIATSRRQQTGFALIFMDLDRFKNINDSIGHDAGDMLLQIIAERLQSTVRNSDMVVRLGGDEFVLLITDVKKMESVALIAQKILDNVLRVITINKQELYVTTSIGISLYPYDGQNMQTLMKHADLALYRSKEQGRNNYQFYTNEMTVKAQEKLSLQNAIGHALAKEEFLLHYQPVMKIKDRSITGVEALLRWRNKDYTAVTPDEIITLAEETGLIIPVSEWVLATACKQLKSWHDMGFHSMRMAVNCSARQFKHANFPDEVLKVLARFGLQPNVLEVEITEGLVMNDPENTLRVLYALKDIGVKIVIDDFGTGYWSLGNLRRLSVDKIKIDRSFIKQLAVDETSAAITTAILAMARRLNIATVAEGVETHQQYEFLQREGCSQIQGYYLTRPLPNELMTKFLKHPTPDAETIVKTESIS